MSVQVRWLCDWCGKLVMHDAIHSRPKGWVKLIRSGPLWGDLCDKCVEGKPKHPVTKHVGAWVEQVQVPRQRLKTVQPKHDPAAAKEAVDKLWEEVGRPRQRETEQSQHRTERFKELTKSLGIATPSNTWIKSVLTLSLILSPLTLKCRADTAPLVTNTFSVPATNEHMFYRLQAVPPVPQAATNEVSGGQTLQPSSPMKFASTSATNAPTNVPMVVPVDQIATMVLTTNWSDFPPPGTAPVATTLQDTLHGLEYGTLVTNKVIQVLEDGVLHPIVVHSYTNTVEVLTRTFQFQRVPDHRSVRRHVKTAVGVR